VRLVRLALKSWVLLQSQLGILVEVPVLRAEQACGDDDSLFKFFRRHLMLEGSLS
jgi:hypothetical protein